MAKLKSYYKFKQYEVGCDEAGRGCLAGPVFAAAVMLDPTRPIRNLNDSKQLSELNRLELREEIMEKALFWVVESIDVKEIDKLNILWASLKAMSLAVRKIPLSIKAVLIDGNKNCPYINHLQFAIVKGDAKYQSIAAASILAKTFRDDYMLDIHEKFPYYHWDNNKGYPTEEHRKAILQYGPCAHHRLSFNLGLSQKENSLFDESKD